MRNWTEVDDDVAMNIDVYQNRTIYNLWIELDS